MTDFKKFAIFAKNVLILFFLLCTMALICRRITRLHDSNF